MLDVSKKDGIVDLSLREDLVAAAEGGAGKKTPKVRPQENKTLKEPPHRCVWPDESEVWYSLAGWMMMTKQVPSNPDYCDVNIVFSLV